MWLTSLDKQTENMETIYHLLDVALDKKDALIKAISTVDGFAGWWTTKTEQVEPGKIRFHFPGHYYKDFKAIENKGDHFVYECLDATPEWKGTRFSFKLIKDNDKMMIHFRHSGWKDQTPMFGICSYHWALYMKSLRDYIETGKGQPTAVL